jgi:hypothetical protein
LIFCLLTGPKGLGTHLPRPKKLSRFLPNWAKIFFLGYNVLTRRPYYLARLIVPFKARGPAGHFISLGKAGRRKPTGKKPRRQRLIDKKLIGHFFG